MIPLHTFRSLRHRNFRIYFLGQLVSLNGTWMQTVAQSWLIYRLTESGLMLGLSGTLTLLPNLVFGIYAGWLADRFPRKKILIVVQVFAMLQALILGILTIGGWIEPWHILLLALALGLVHAIETPVRQSFILQLVVKDDLTNAIALSASIFHLARFFGPALAGALVALFGEGPVFLINATTFIAVLVSLFSLKLAEVPSTGLSRSGTGGIWAGLHFARQHGLVRALLVMVAAVSLLGGATMVLMPMFIHEVFARGPESLGIFMGILGAGSLAAALMLAQQRDFQLLERRVAIAAISVASGLLLFSVNEYYSVALVILFVTGFASTTVFASSNALIQLTVPDHLRGRTMALFTVCFHGMVAIGQLVLGTLADSLGAPSTVAISAGTLFLLALILTLVLYKVGIAEEDNN